MKRNILLLIVISLMSSPLMAQEYQIDYKKRAEDNAKILINPSAESVINGYFNITDKGIQMFSDPRGRSGGKPEFTLYYDEVNFFLNYLKEMDHNVILDWYKAKGSRRLVLNEELREYNHYTYKPENMKGLKIAIDAGHMAHDIKSAIKERKFIRMEASVAGTKKDIEFYEADLAFKQYLILKDTLESLGAEVYGTREEGQSAVGKPFDKWVVEDYDKAVNYLEENEVYSAGFIEKLKSTDASEWLKFKYVYSYFDFVNRAWGINEFKPDLTLILHFNADENGKRYWEEGYWTPTENNYSMAFVPGSFLKNELTKVDYRIDFLRLLVSPGIEESIRLSQHIMDGHETTLGVEAYPWNDESSMLKNCVNVNGKGVFARNLYMTRAIESGGITYLESLYQDNLKEAIRLNKMDYKLKNGSYTSSRVAEAAFVDISAIYQWLDENKELNDTAKEYVFIRENKKETTNDSPKR